MKKTKLKVGTGKKICAWLAVFIHFNVREMKKVLYS